MQRLARIFYVTILGKKLEFAGNLLGRKGTLGGRAYVSLNAKESQMYNYRGSAGVQDQVATRKQL